MQSRSNDFFNVGFHGDKYLLEIISNVIAELRIDTFIETGTNVGTTLSYVARNYVNLSCFSCEPDKVAYDYAQSNLVGLHNAVIENSESNFFLENICSQVVSDKSNLLFWLDAHGYGFQWPLKFEIEYITSFFTKAVVLIDDFKVPDMECFGYDEYQDQICSWEYIKDSLNLNNTYQIYYPNYTECTSNHHPLRGWVLIAWGNDVSFLEELNLSIKKFDYVI